jgi:transcriptional regulator with XRE-family HTH domain
MKGSSYRERDYAFGQLMLTLRTKLGLTQAALAEILGVRRRTIIDWEGGLSYPSINHLKHFVTLAVERQIFPAGHEAEEVHALWEAAQQKILLDEEWLRGLLSHEPVLPDETDDQSTAVARHSDPSFAGTSVYIDWDDAPTVANFYGREWEREELATWITREHCRVVSVLGQGGIGKSVLATQVMRHVAQDFDVVIWRSLRDVPTCEALLDSCLQVLAPQSLSLASSSLQTRQALLLECLRGRRVLLVYDNLESFLGEGEDSGRLLAGYKGFSSVLRQIAETEHQSCLMLTSREKPEVLLPMEGDQAPVRALRVSWLDIEACQKLLIEKGVTGSLAEFMRLITTYGGNPLALKIVAQSIIELFAGQVAPFLAQDEIVFGGVRSLLDEQYARLSAVERSVLLWLTILREPVRIQELLTLPGIALPGAQILEAINNLQRRSLVEPGKLAGSFTLQGVVMEYMVVQLIAEVADEILQGQCSRLIEHCLEPASSQEYIRLAQQRLLILPVLARLRRSYPKVRVLEEHLLALLDGLREWAHEAQGYGPTNLLVLLRELRGHLRDLDLSNLSLRDAYLQGVEMQDTTLAGATLQETIFTGSFDAPWSVVISPKGQYWAMGSRRGEVRLWRAGGNVLAMAWQAHSAAIQALAFSPCDPVLATGSWDGQIKVWDLEHDTLRWVARHGSSVQRLVFAPDGRTLATAGDNAAIRLWDVATGELLQTLDDRGGSSVYALAWSLDGRRLASGSFDGTIALWETRDGVVVHPSPVHRLIGHDGPVWSVAF